MENEYPIGGYAPGNYLCKCTDCGKQFTGNKRAVQCEPCAVKQEEAFNALTADEQHELLKRNAETIKRFFDERRADAERRANADYSNLGHNESNYVRDSTGKIIAIKK